MNGFEFVQKWFWWQFAIRDKARIQEIWGIHLFWAKLFSDVSDTSLSLCRVVYSEARSHLVDKNHRQCPISMFLTRQIHWSADPHIDWWLIHVENHLNFLVEAPYVDGFSPSCLVGYNPHIRLYIIPGWWFGTFFICPFNWEESSQLTFIFFRAVGIPPTRYVWYPSFHDIPHPKGSSPTSLLGVIFHYILPLSWVLLSGVIKRACLENHQFSSLMFPLKAPFIVDFQLPCLMTPEGTSHIP